MFYQRCVIVSTNQKRVFTWQTCLECGYLRPGSSTTSIDPGNSELVGSARLQLQLLSNVLGSLQ